MISAVGGAVSPASTIETNGLTATITPGAIGNLIVLDWRIPLVGLTQVTMSGGNCNWNFITIYGDVLAAPSTHIVAFGVANDDGAADVQVTLHASSNVTPASAELSYQEFSSDHGAATLWHTDGNPVTQGAGITGTVLTAGTLYSNLDRVDEVFVAYAHGSSDCSAGATSGITYNGDAASPAGMWMFDTDAWGKASTASCSQATSGKWSTIAIKIAASLATVLGGTQAGVSVPAAQPGVTYSPANDLVTLSTGGLGLTIASPTITWDQTTVEIDDVVFVDLQFSPSAGLPITSLSGGGCTWTKLIAPDPSNSNQALYMGVVNSVGTSTVTATWTGPGTINKAQLQSQEFSTNLLSPVWHLVESGWAAYKGMASTVEVPRPGGLGASAGDLFWGYVASTETSPTGDVSGYSYPTSYAGMTDGYSYTSSAGSEAVPGSPGSTVDPQIALSPATPYVATGATVRATGTLPTPVTRPGMAGAVVSSCSS